MADPTDSPVVDEPVVEQPTQETQTDLSQQPDNFATLADVFKQEEPELSSVEKGKPTDPENADKFKDAGVRGPDGKFLKKEAQTGPAQTGATEGATGATGAVEAKPTGRDADLDTTKLEATMRPSTRKVIDGFKNQAVAARNERDELKTKYEQAEARAKELEEKVKTAPVPKEMEEEVKTLRARVRELDISKDPAMEAKYDKRVKSNASTAIEILKENGIFMKSVEKDKPPVEMNESEKKALTAEIEKGGVGIRTMAKYIRALEQGGEYESAERLRALAQHNDRLAQEKAEEIATWEKDYEGFKAKGQQQSKAAQEAYVSNVRATGEKELSQELTELAKNLPFIKQPAPVLPSDTAEVKAAKEKALGEYNAGVKAVEEATRIFNTEGKNESQAAEAQGKQTAASIVGVILKTQVVPRLLREAAEMQARIKELESGEAKGRRAVQINRAHAAAITQPDNKNKAPDANMSDADALKMMAKEMGAPVDT